MDRAIMACSVHAALTRDRPPDAAVAGAAASAALPLSGEKLGGLRHIPALDGVRGLAILLVLLFHYLGTNWTPVSTHSGYFAGRIIENLCAGGWSGVDLFFVLSGFLITRILLDARETPHYFRNFYVRRVLRIFPLYYGVLLAMFVVGPLASSRVAAYLARFGHDQVWLWTYTMNIRNLLTYRESRLLLDLGHFWSLAVEEQFYLVWPALVWMLSRRALTRLALGCVLGAILLRTAMFFGHVNSYAIFTFTPCRIDAFALGAFVSLMMNRDVSQLRKWARRIGLAAGLLLAVIFLWRGTFFAADPVMLTIGYSVIAVFWTCVLVEAAHAGDRGMFGVVFNSRWLRSLGKYSYGIYVYHAILQIFIFDHLWPRGELIDRFGSNVAAVLIYATFNVGCSIALAVLSYELYEKQFLGLKRFLAVQR